MLNDFIAQVKTGSIARNNRYTVMFGPPKELAAEQRLLESVLLFCDQVQLPGVNFSTVQNRTFGEFREVPYEKLFDNISMSFYVDQSMQVKTLFDNWINTIQDQSTRTFGYYNDYITNMEIEVQDTQDKTRYQVTLWECYPKTIGSIQLDYANKDIMKLQVTMQYKYWTASSVSVLASGEEIPEVYFDQYNQNYTGFQRDLNNVIGPRPSNFSTGARSAVISQLPSLLRY